MPTDKPRIQVTLDNQTSGMLSALAKSRHESRSALAADLIRQAIDLQEDLYLSGVAKNRDKKSARWRNHDDAWK